MSVTITQRVKSYFEERKVAVTKQRMMQHMKLSKASVDYACRKLRKQGVIGYTKSWRPTHGSSGRLGRQVRTYWGLK